MSIQTQPTVQEFFSKYPVKKYRAGEAILTPGKLVQDLHFVESGHVREYLISTGGAELTVHIYDRGAAFPLIQTVHNQETEHYYESLDSCEIRIAPAQEFFEFLKTQPALLFDTLARLLLGIQGLVDRIEYLTLNKASARLAASLLYLSKHFGQQNGQSIEFTERFTHQEIASVVGLARETVSLELEQMAARGLIAYKGRLLTIPNIAALQSLMAS